MRTKKRFETKHLMLIIFMVCMVITLLPSKTYAGTPMTKVSLGGKILDYENRYLINGEPKKNGSLGIDGCTAELTTDGTLKLSGYNGSSIIVDGSPKADMNILLFQNNIITANNQNAYDNIYGLRNWSGGDINITGETGTKLEINLKMIGNWGRGAYGISTGREDVPASKINIKGNANVSIKVETTGYKNYSYGMTTTGSVNISDNASTKIILYGGRTNGIYAGNRISINTEKEVGIWSFGDNIAKEFVFADSVTDAAVDLIKAKSLIHVGKTKIQDLKVNYEPNKFGVNDKSAGPGFNQRTYRYGNAFILKVNNGSGSGSYLDTDPVTITANLPDPNFMFKEWEGGGDNLAYLNGTSRTSAKATFLMRSNKELTATYQTAIFIEQPKGGIKASTGDPIPFSWSLSNFEGSVKWASIQEKIGDGWQNYDSYDLPYKAPGGEYKHSVKSSTPGTRTFRIEYVFPGPAATYYRHYSDEFTMTWVDTGVESITVSPKTASVQKGTSRLFTADVEFFGVGNDNVDWSVTGRSEYSTTFIDRYGKLSVDKYEDAETLKVTAVSKLDNTKKASAIVAVTNTPVTKYILNVIGGKGSGEYVEGDTITMEVEAPISKVFYKWVTTDMPLEDDSDLDPNFEFLMPDKNIEITAIYKDKHLLLVDKKIPEASYIGYGELVTVVADEPPENKIFDKWISEDISIIPDLADNPTYHFHMPDKKVTITPTYKDMVSKASHLQLLWVDAYKIDEDNYRSTKYMHTSPGFEPENKVYTLDLTKEYDGVYLTIMLDESIQDSALTIDGVKKDLLYSGSYDDNIKYYWTDYIPREGDTSKFVITVTPKDGTAPDTYQVTINWKSSIVAPVIDDLVFPNGIVGTQYDHGLAIRGTNPMEWDIISGDLPNNLRIYADPSKANRIQGIPTKAGTYSFQLKAENAAGYDIKTKSITILEKPLVPEKLTGTVLISGKAKIDETLTAIVSEDCNNTGDLSYKWILTDGLEVENWGEHNPLFVDDVTSIGRYFICEVTSNAQAGKIYGYSGIIEKLDSPAAPENLIPISPTSLGGKDGRITGTSIFMEYADNKYFTDAEVCDDKETKGLKAGYYYIRLRDTQWRYASDYATIVVPDYEPGVSEANEAITRAKDLLPDGLDVVEGRDTNILDMLREIPGITETGVTLSLDGISNANIASNGKITYGDSEVSGYVDVKINKAPGTERVEMVMIVVPAAAIMYGDVNGDGFIDIVDLISVAKNIAGTYTFNAQQVLAADVNGDGEVDIVDYVSIAQRIAGTLPKFPVEP